MRKNIHYKVLILLVVAIGTLNFSAVGQLRIDSPYSRYGLGDVNPGYNSYQASMGGAGYGVKDSLRISTINPASYASIDSGSFLFNAGFNGLLINTTTSNQSGGSSYFNLSYLKFALPVTTWWRSGAGLMPYSTVGYNVNTYDNIDSIGLVRFAHLGDGGITRVYWGNSIKVTKKLAIGVNMSYLFGSVNFRREDLMVDLPYAFQYRITNTADVRSIYFDYGLQYNTNFGKDNLYFFGLGLTYANQQKFTSSNSALAFTYTVGADGHEFIKDTLLNDEHGESEIVIPQKIGGGFSIGKRAKWMFVADATFDEWSKFEAFKLEDNLTNSIRVNLGGQYYIGKYAVNAGFRYNDSYLELNNTKINDYGITLGVSIPLRSIASKRMGKPSSVSFVDLGFEFGRRGTTSNNLIQQDYFKFRLGINIKNTWFQRVKYL